MTHRPNLPRNRARGVKARARPGCFDITTRTTTPPPLMNAQQPLRIHRDQRKKKLKRCQRRPPGGARERVGEARCYRLRGGFVYGAMRRAAAATAEDWRT